MPGLTGLSGLSGLSGEIGGAVANGLFNALIAYWPGNEVNGNALDAHVNALHLDDHVGVGSNPGLVYPLARQYTGMMWHARPGDDALLSLGDVDCTFATWVNLDDKTASRIILVKNTFAPPNKEYYLRYDSGADRFIWTVYDGTNTVAEVVANTLGSPATGTWYLLTVDHDGVANEVSIQVNNGAADSGATAGVPADTAAPFMIVGSGGLWMRGLIGPTAFWKSAVGGGGVLTVAQRTAFYNGGAGLPYAALTL